MDKISWEKISEVKGPEQSLGFLLWRISTDWRRQIESALSSLSLTHPQFVLLANIGWLTRKGDWVTQVELARQCNTDITMTSQVLRSLEKKGLIERVQRDGDQRAKWPRLTTKGAELLEKAVPLVEAVDRRFFEILGDKSRECLAIFQLLAKMK